MMKKVNEKNGMRNLVRRAAYTPRVMILLYFCIKQNTNNKECNQNNCAIKISGRYVVIQKNKELSNNCTTIVHMNSFRYLVTGELDERG